MSLLQVESLGIDFGGLRAVNDVSFSLKAGEIVSVIGPNGAGKTTLFNMISGVYLPGRGKSCSPGKRSPASARIFWPSAVCRAPFRTCRYSRR